MAIKEINSNRQKDVSILIKTFNRQKSLIKLLRSLEKLNCSLPVLIADDSEKPYRDEVLSRFPNMNIAYYVLPFDTGLSAGRNKLLNEVKTSHFLLCDDDFSFDRTLDIPHILSVMESHQLDIAGGILFNHITVMGVKRFFSVMLNPRIVFRYIFHISSVSRYAGHFSVQHTSCTLSVSNRKHADAVHSCDLVNNFFIARTDSVVKAKGWDTEFKVGEHEDFFYRAKLNGLKVALVEDLSAHHYPGAKKDYLAFRERAVELKKNFPRKFAFTEYREINTDTNTVLFSYRAGEDNTSPLLVP